MKRNLSLLTLMAFVLTLAIAGCQREGCTDPKATNYDPDAKKDNGTCVYSEPEQDSVIPTKEKVFDVDWHEGIGIAPSADSMKKYTDNPEYKYVFINFVNKTFPSTAGQDGMQCSGYVVRNFKRARDTLQTRIDINPKKVRGSGKIILDQPGSASLPDDASQTTLGMTKRDSAWYAQNGWGFGYARNFSK